MKLELKNVGLSYGDHAILRQLTCQIPDFKTLALIGPSGGGKSSLLRLLAGLIPPMEGQIMINEVQVPSTEIALRQYRQKLGVVFQAFNLFPHLDARHNIMLPLTEVHQYGLEEAKRAADELLERLGLSEHASKFPFQLSGGQRQRVAIARALAPQPRLLLLDEPTSALDPEMTSEVLDLLEEIKERGCPYILVTHAMGFARRVADHVLFLSQGRIVEQGSAQELFAKPQTPDCARFLEKVFKY